MINEETKNKIFEVLKQELKSAELDTIKTLIEEHESLGKFANSLTSDNEVLTDKVFALNRDIVDLHEKLSKHEALDVRETELKKYEEILRVKNFEFDCKANYRQLEIQKETEKTEIALGLFATVFKNTEVKKRLMTKTNINGSEEKPTFRKESYSDSVNCNVNKTTTKEVEENTTEE